MKIINVVLLTVISLSFSSNMYILCYFSFILINKNVFHTFRSRLFRFILLIYFIPSVLVLFIFCLDILST